PAAATRGDRVRYRLKARPDGAPATGLPRGGQAHQHVPVRGRVRRPAAPSRTGDPQDQVALAGRRPAGGGGRVRRCAARPDPGRARARRRRGAGRPAPARPRRHPRRPVLRRPAGRGRPGGDRRAARAGSYGHRHAARRPRPARLTGTRAAVPGRRRWSAGDRAPSLPGRAAPRSRRWPDEPVGCGAMTPSPPRVRRLPRPRYLAISGLVVVLVLALVAGVGAVWAVRRPFPTYDGQLTVPGLTAPVTVHRDRYGIPQVYAETIEDLFFAQGFVHAQDRFWEMDFRRHVTAGRTAELFGEDQVATDAFLRALGWRRVAEAEWNMVSPQTRRYLTAYADGVNAWIAHTGGPAATGRKSLHYRLLGLLHSGYEVEPWHPVDTLAWLKAMAWDLRTNVVDETDRALLLAAGLPASQVEELYPEYPFDRHAPIVSGGRVVDGEFVPEDAPADDEPREPPVETLALAADTLSEIAELAA